MQKPEVYEKAKKGDSAAFSEIYDAFADKIFKYIRFKVQNQSQAEDILQEVFIKVWRGLPGLKISPELNFSAWIYKIAQNAMNDHFRKIYRAPETLELDENLPVFEENSAAENIDTAANTLLVKNAFEHLPAQYKEILELRFIQDLSIAEVSNITGKNSLAVRLAQHRALKKLRQILGTKYGIGYGQI